MNRNELFLGLLEMRVTPIVRWVNNVQTIDLIRYEFSYINYKTTDFIVENYFHSLL